MSGCLPMFKIMSSDLITRKRGNVPSTAAVLPDRIVYGLAFCIMILIIHDRILVILSQVPQPPLSPTRGSATEADIERKITVYDKWDSEKTIEFLERIKPYMKINKLNVENEYTQNNEPMVVVCLHNSRIESNLEYTLDNIDRSAYKNIVVVLVHWKVEDTSNVAEQLMSERELTILDAFLQEDRSNIQIVAKQIRKKMREKC